MTSEIEKLIRIGKVSSVNAEQKTARVIFENLGGMVSGDLPILQNAGTVNISSTTVSYGGESKQHGHAADIAAWLPAVNQYVLCIYLPVFNGDGFIIGGLP